MKEKGTRENTWKTEMKTANKKEQRPRHATKKDNENKKRNEGERNRTIFTRHQVKRRRNTQVNGLHLRKHVARNKLKRRMKRTMEN